MPAPAPEEAEDGELEAGEFADEEPSRQHGWDPYASRCVSLILALFLDGCLDPCCEWPQAGKLLIVPGEASRRSWKSCSAFCMVTQMVRKCVSMHACVSHLCLPSRLLPA